MASIVTTRVTSVVSAITTSNCTITSTTGLYAGMYGTLVGPLGVPAGVRVKITEVVSATVIRCVLAPEYGFVPSTGQGSNLAAYATGTIYFEPQVVSFYNVVV
jgi:hypothetical protein